MGNGKRMVYYDQDLRIEACRFLGLMQKFPNHFHEYYVIGYIENGKRKMSCKNSEYMIHTGDLIFFNPYDTHACEQVDHQALDYRSLHIKSEIMRKMMKEITGEDKLPHFTSPVIYQSDKADLLRTVHQMIMNNNSTLEKEEAFYFLIEQLVNEYTDEVKELKPKSAQYDIQSICDYLDSHYNEPITLDEMAEQTDMNKYHLLRVFTRERGITPYRYLQTVRIMEAKKQLENGEKVIHVALNTGFVDQSHFSKFFLNFIGVTPAQYRNLYVD